MEHRHEDADAYFISCAQVRAAEVIETLERDLQRPVVTSNQAAAWHCLRESGIRDKVAGFGTLFRCNGPTARVPLKRGLSLVAVLRELRA